MQRMLGLSDRWTELFGETLSVLEMFLLHFDKDGYLYNHETGTSDNGSAMTSFIESSPGEIPNTGQNLYLVDKVIPDVTMTSDTTLSSFYKYKEISECNGGY
jgi:hypothetical protein